MPSLLEKASLSQTSKDTANDVGRQVSVMVVSEFSAEPWCSQCLRGGRATLNETHHRDTENTEVAQRTFNPGCQVISPTFR